MPGSSSPTNSFIPKRGHSERRHVQPARKLFVVTIIAYSFVFAALLAAGASVLYKNYTESQLEKEVILLNKEINTFSVEDLRRVEEFDVKLQKATKRVLHTASIVAVLDTLELMTVAPMQISRLTLTREQDDYFDFEVALKTDTLDAALFQRKVLLSSDRAFSAVAFSEINLMGGAAEGETAADAEIALKLTFQTPLDELLYDPANALATTIGSTVDTPLFEPIIVPEIVDESEDAFISSPSSNDISS